MREAALPSRVLSEGLGQREVGVRAEGDVAQEGLEALVRYALHTEAQIRNPSEQRAQGAEGMRHRQGAASAGSSERREQRAQGAATAVSKACVGFLTC